MKVLHSALSECTWDVEGITAGFKEASVQAGVGMRDVYRASYAVFMGAERGPRLAPILSNCEREEMLTLVKKSAAL